MKTIQDVIDKRNELFEKIMDNASFMMIYNGDLAGEEDEEELLRKMQKLDDAIYDFPVSYTHLDVYKRQG